MKIIAVFLIMYFVSVIDTMAQVSSDFTPEVKAGATIYTGWEFNIDNSNFIMKLDSASPNPSAAFGYNPVKNQFETGQNSFYLDRAYLNLNASLSPTIRGRLTSDVFSFTDGNQKTQYELGIKFAWLAWTFLKNKKGMALDLSLGVIPNQWIPICDKYFGYRGFARTLTDFQWTISASRSSSAQSGAYNVSRTTGSYFPAADLGANLSLTYSEGLGEFYLNVFNGGGFRNLNLDNRFKDIEAIVLVHPLAKKIKDRYNQALKIKDSRISGVTDLTFGGFFYTGKLGLGENYFPGGVQYKRKRFGGLFNLKYNFVKSGFIKVGGECAFQNNQDPIAGNPVVALDATSTGYSAYFEFNPPVAELNEKLMLIARYDMFDPDNADNSSSPSGFNNSNDAQNFLLLGLAFRESKVATFGISYQRMGYQAPFIVNYDGTTSDSDSRLFVHGILDF